VEEEDEAGKKVMSEHFQIIQGGAIQETNSEKNRGAGAFLGRREQGPFQT